MIAIFRSNNSSRDGLTKYLKDLNLDPCVTPIVLVAGEEFVGIHDEHDTHTHEKHEEPEVEPVKNVKFN